MARNGLVIGQRAHAELRDLGGIAQVDVEHARPRTVEGRRVVIRARRGLLAEFRHTFDLHALLGPHVEGVVEAGVDLFDDGGEVGDDRRAAFVGIGIELVGASGDHLHALADRAFLQAFADQDGVHLGLDARDLVQAHLVDLRRRHVGAGVLARRPGVEGGAVRQGPDAMVAGGFGQQGVVVGDELAVGRVHLAGDRRLDPGEQRLALAVGQGAGRQLVELLDEGGVEDVFLRRRAGEGAHLGQHLLDHEGRRQDAGLLARMQAFHHLGDHRRGLGQARDVVLGFAGRGHRMLGGEEGREVALHAEQLVERVVVQRELLALLLDGEEIFQDVVGQPAAFVQCGAVVLAQGGQVVAKLGLQLALAGQGPVGQVVAVPVHPGRQHAQRAEHLRVVHRVFDEDPLEEPVDLQRLGVHRVQHQAGAERQHQEQQPAGQSEQGLHQGSPGNAGTIPEPGRPATLPQVMSDRLGA